MVAAQLPADRARRRALGLLELAADPLAQLLAAVLAYRPQPRAWPRPRPPWLPRLRG